LRVICPLFCLAFRLLGQASDIGANLPPPEATSPCLPVLANLDGWYDFEAPLASSASTTSVGGLGPEAASFGNPVTIPGLVGSALRFNGGSFLEITNSTAFNYPTQNFSVSVWLRTTNAGAVFVDKRCIGTAGGCRTPQGWAIAVSPAGHLQLLMGSALPYFYEGFLAFNLKKINDGEWHFIVVSVDRTLGRVTFAVDPASETDIQFTSIEGYVGAIQSVRPLRIGGDQISPAKFVGDLDEVQFYGRALLPSEARNLFAAGPAGQCRPPVCSAVSARRSMVGWYGFEEVSGLVWNDRAAQNNFLSGSTEQIVGQIGLAVQFVRTAPGGGLRTVDGAAELDAGVGNFALAAWIRYFPSGAGRRAILDKHGDDRGSGGGYSMLLEDGFLRLQISPAGSPRSAASFWTANRTRLDDGRWHHVAAVVDRGVTAPALYVDGALETLGAARGPMPLASLSSGSPLHVGAFSAETSDTIGAIDELAIFNSTLSAAEVQSIFAAAGTGYCRRNDQGCVAAPPGLLSWYRFENATGPFDDSGFAPNEPMVIAGNITRGVGRVGRGVRLQEGTNSLRTLGATPKLNFDTGPFSFGFWLQPGSSLSANAGGRTILEKMTYTSPPNAVRPTQGYRLRLVNGRLEFALVSGGNLGLWTGNTTLRADQWVQVSVLVPRDAEPRIFVNGVAETLASAGIVPTGSLATPNPLQIGVSSDSTLNPVDPIAFEFDELSFYSRVLTLAELQALAQGNAGQCFEGQVASVKPVFEVGTNPANIGATVGVSGDSSGLDNYATTIAPSAVSTAPSTLTAPGGNIEYRFRDWTLNGQVVPEWTSTVQSVPLPTNASSYLANYDTYHRLTVTVAGNCRVTPLPGFYLAGSTLPVNIILPTGWVVNSATFAAGNGFPSPLNSSGAVVTLTAPSTLDVVCRNSTVFAITVGTFPANVGLQVIADGNLVSNAQNFSWPTIPPRILAVPSQIQVVGLTQYTFRRWRNAATNVTLAAAPLSQVIVLPLAPTSYVADFEPTGFQVLVRQPTGCTIDLSPVTGSSGYYSPGSRLTVNLIASAGYTPGMVTVQPLSASNATTRPAPADVFLDGPVTISAECIARTATLRFTSAPVPADVAISFILPANAQVRRAQGLGLATLTVAPGIVTLSAAPFTSAGTDGAIRRFVDITPGNLSNGVNFPAPSMNTAYTANYEVQCYYVTIGQQPATAGSFSLTLLAGEQPYLTENCYVPGSVLRVEAFPRPGFSFQQWIGDAPSAVAVNRFTVTKAITVSALYRSTLPPTAAPNSPPPE